MRHPTGHPSTRPATRPNGRQEKNFVLCRAKPARFSGITGWWRGLQFLVRVAPARPNLFILNINFFFFYFLPRFLIESCSRFSIPLRLQPHALFKFAAIPSSRVLAIRQHAMMSSSRTVITCTNISMLIR